MKPGDIGWHDLTVPNAVDIRNFYEKVVGWKWSGVNMGGYEDFTMLPLGSEDAVAGICHARGPNAEIPPQWLMYIVVDDVDAGAASCVELGGKILVAPRSLSGGRFCVIKDPAGAVCALYQQ